MAGPLELVASMVLDNGARWGDSARPEQWEDMKALLDPAGPRRHFWLRARGASKTHDCAAATLAMMLAGGIRPGDEMYAAASGKWQAGFLLKKIKAIAANTPELAGAVKIDAYKVTTPRTGASLDVISADLPSSWGTTPKWLFIDEIANHEKTDTSYEFVNSLLTALLKRPDSVGLMATTPSSPSHWSYPLWQAAQAGGLWRASLTPGAAPWQDPAELEAEERRLPESLWRRLFLCEWAEADDSLADAAAVDECVRHDGDLPPQPGTTYVVAFDLSYKKDHTAVVVAHLEDAGGLRTVVIDRLQAWIPKGGREVPLADVMAWIRGASADYGSAQIVGDPYQAQQQIQQMRSDGYRIKPIVFNAGTVSKRAQLLMRLIKDRCLALPSDDQLRRELLSLRLTEGSTPGVVKLTTDGTSQGHFDRVTALMLAAEELLSQPQGSYHEVYGKLAECGRCNRWYQQKLPACSYCGEPNPEPKASAILAASTTRPGRPAAPEPVIVSPNSHASAYYPPNAVRCAAGHVYDGQANPHSCPNCLRGSLGVLRNLGRTPGGIGGMFPGGPR